jgi:hypothetical protein
MPICYSLLKKNENMFWGFAKTKQHAKAKIKIFLGFPDCKLTRTIIQST